MGIGGPGETWPRRDMPLYAREIRDQDFLSDIVTVVSVGRIPEEKRRKLKIEELRAGAERVKAKLDSSGDWYAVNYATGRSTTYLGETRPIKIYRFHAPDDNTAEGRVIDRSVLREIAEREHVDLSTIEFVGLDKLNSTGRFVAWRILEKDMRAYFEK